MFEIAAGIILAYVVIATFSIWFWGGLLVVAKMLEWFFWPFRWVDAHKGLFWKGIGFVVATLWLYSWLIGHLR